MSENLQHCNDFNHICLCLLLLPMSNPFFLRGKTGIPSRHQINKPNLILPEIKNFYCAPSYSSPFWCTQSKRIGESIPLKLCDLRWTPVSCWEFSKLLGPAYKVLNSFGPGRCGEVTFHSKNVEVHQDKYTRCAQQRVLYFGNNFPYFSNLSACCEACFPFSRLYQMMWRGFSVYQLSFITAVMFPIIK